MRLVVFGAKGRVGSRVVHLAKNHEVWQIDKNYSKNALSQVDVVVDFSLADATEQVVDFCLRHRCPLVTGVTGRNQQQQVMIDKLAEKVAVVQSANFCQGIELLQEICKLVAQKTNWQCEIIETHHTNKKDSPSGTAKSLASAITQSRGSFCSTQIHSLRLGSNSGEHTVIFATNGQSLTLTHKAESIDVFAKGALDQAIKLSKDKM